MPSAARKTIVTHFTITGEGFTRIARDFMLSDLPAKAWRLMSTGLPGSEPFATKVLDGTMKLVGNESSMRATKDNSKGAKGYAKTLQYIYAGRIRIGKAWFRPRSEVVEFGPDDARFAAEQVMEDGGRGVPTTLADGGKAFLKFARERVRAYTLADERVVEIPKEPKGIRYVIFEPVSEPPFWWNELRDPAEALKAWEAAGHELRQERWSEHFEPEPPDSGEVEIADDDQEARDDARAKAYRASQDKIRETVLAQAAGDMMDLHLDDGTKVATVPRAPFINWCVNRTSIKHLAPPWDLVSPCGMKMPMDDQHHTDWFYGATIHVTEKKTEEETELEVGWLGGPDPYRYEYDSPLNKAAYREMGEIQQALGEFEATVIVDAGEIHGVVGKDIVVLPDLQPDHVEKIVGARAVITETGGRVAHIAQVALERNITVMRVPDACTRYPADTTLTLTPATGKIEIDVKRW